ncbi:Hypothetical predicted protein [Cloeon dipterum]|uniref:Protein lava lamp n=1 Tax=Cloeon dipterum TaxID=197152 RepID=A0A8S1BLU2_9INSE|nr:Hypothetical predicted protein [Cloeon dipterum]
MWCILLFIVVSKLVLLVHEAITNTQFQSALNTKTMDDSVPNVAELEDQFAAQQSMIEQMRDTLLQREQTASSNEKKVQDYAATLSRIRSSHRPSKKKEDNKSLMALDITPEKGPSSKMTLLRKQMEENRAILEQRGKLINEHKQSVEGMVELLSAQLTEKDLALEEVRRTRDAQENLPMINPTSEEGRELYAHVMERDNKIIELNNKILELERSIMDYEETLREKESVLEARTRAVALVQEDLGHKHSIAVHQLEDALKEVAELKALLATQEEQLKQEKLRLVENLAAKEQRLSQLETIRFDLCTRNAELQHKIVALQTKSHEVLSQGLPQDKERIEELESKIEEISASAAEEVNALKTKLEDGAKLLTKAKVAYAKKLKNLEQKLQQSGNVQELEQKVAELEEEKGNLQLLLVDFEEIKASEMLLREKVSELEALTAQQMSTLEVQSKNLRELEETNATNYAELQQLRASEAELQTELEAAKMMVQDSECTAVRANMKTVELEERLEQAEKAYKQLTAEVESLATQKVTNNSQELQDVVDAASREKSALCDEIERLERERSAQEMIYKEASEALARVQQTLALKATEHEAEVESLQAQIAAKEQRASQLEERIAFLTEESQQSLAQLNQSMGEAQLAQEALARANSVVTEEEGRIAMADQQIASLEMQISELRRELEQSRQYQEQESQARSYAQEEVRQLRARLEESAVQLESASETLSQLESLRQEHDKLQRRYADETISLKSRLEQAEDEASASASQAGQNHKDHQAAMESWNKEMQFLKEHITGLESANNELYEQIENLGLEKESVQSELWSLQEELGNLKQSAENLQDETLRSLNAEKENLNQQIQAHVAKINELQSFINTQKSELESYQSSVSMLTKDLEDRKAADGSREQALEEFRAKLQSLEVDLKTSSEEKEQLLKQNGDLQAQLLAHQNQQNAMEGMNAHMASVSNELEQLRWTVGEKDQALQMIGQQVASYENHCIELNSHIKKMEESLAQSNASKEQLQKNLNESQFLISQIQTDQQRKEVEIHSKLSELESINNNLQECLEQEKKSHEAQVASLMLQVGQLTEQLNEAQQLNKSSIITDEVTWGEDAWQEPVHQPFATTENSNTYLVAELQKQLKEADDVQTKLTEDLRASQIRCGKALKQLKLMKEQKKPASDLDKVMEEELQSQIAALQKELSETQAERSVLAAKTETLKDANLRLSESKKHLDGEIERLKAERLALEQEAADWSQDDRVETLERQLQDMYLRCKELEEHIAGDEETEAESIVLQENLIKSRERCAELERMKQMDEEKLTELEAKLQAAIDLNETLKNSTPSVEEIVTAATAPIVEAARVIPPPSMTEMATMTEEVAVSESSSNTDAPPVETKEQQQSPPLPTKTDPAEVEKLAEALRAKQKESESLAALVAQLRGALEVKMQEVLSLTMRGSDTLQSELDSALYQLHQRDVRCDELTLELMALMEERDALQLRLSSALRLNAAHEEQLKENDGQSEDLQMKLHELHSVGHKRDVSLRGEQEARFTEQQAAFLPQRHSPQQQRALQIEGSLCDCSIFYRGNKT